MKKSLFFVVGLFLTGLVMAHTWDWPTQRGNGSMKAILYFKSYKNYLQYQYKKVVEGLDSATAFYRRLLQFETANFIDYLPLTAGSSYPLTGMLFGTEGSFSTTAARAFKIESSQSGGGDFLVWMRSTNTVSGQSYGLLVDAGTNSSDYPFRVRNAGATAEFFAIAGNGNVGIGTATPTQKLTVGGNLSIQGNDNGLNIYKGDATTQVASLGNYDGANLDEGVLTLFKASAAKVFLSANRASYFNGGNVGIGTTSPESLLHIQGTNSTEIATTIKNTYTSGGSSRYATLLVSGNNGSVQGVYRADPGGFGPAGVASMIIGTTTNQGLSFIANNVSTMFISASGNVGIGTTSPSEKFSVNGSISTKKIIVTQLGWSDYVFSKDYKLRSLQSLEAFINKNNHLPEIPTAKEVEDRGISVGDNQALLLKKIEELTLYIIGLQKQIDKLKIGAPRSNIRRGR
jgi:hypothetical protein